MLGVEFELVVEEVEDEMHYSIPDPAAELQLESLELLEEDAWAGLVGDGEQQVDLEADGLLLFGGDAI